MGLFGASSLLAQTATAPPKRAPQQRAPVVRREGVAVIAKTAAAVAWARTWVLLSISPELLGALCDAQSIWSVGGIAVPLNGLPPPSSTPGEVLGTRLRPTHKGFFLAYETHNAPLLGGEPSRRVAAAAPEDPEGARLRPTAWSTRPARGRDSQKPAAHSEIFNTCTCGRRRQRGPPDKSDAYL